ncbi:hypothetical protein RQ094_003883 [Salmonella enterica]|nr:hypothetical protein [Salmonella enterica]ELI0025977.1 hypothetical protein [Salmonella enterica]ELI0151774.1 hypothetical protein [Salmonella enterica]
MRFLSVLILLPSLSNAFTVDAMFKYANKEDFFIIKGDKKQEREYLYITLSELSTPSEGKSGEMDFSPETVSSWPVLVQPSEIALDEGEQVKVKVIKNDNVPPSLNDRIFGLTFVPDVLKNQRDKTYNVMFGYKVWFIVPGQGPLTGDVTVIKDFHGGDYTVKNGTNKVLAVDINYCTQGEKRSNDCSNQLIAGPGSVKKVSLGQQIRTAEFSFYPGSENNKNNLVKKVRL